MSIDNRYLKAENENLIKGEFEKALESRVGWAMGKIYRQRLAINRIQAKGWQPSIIIEEHDAVSEMLLGLHGSYNNH